MYIYHYIMGKSDDWNRDTTLDISNPWISRSLFEVPQSSRYWYFTVHLWHNKRTPKSTNRGRTLRSKEAELIKVKTCASSELVKKEMCENDLIVSNIQNRLNRIGSKWTFLHGKSTTIRKSRTITVSLFSCASIIFCKCYQ